jgi:hypothetical protein
MEILIMVLVFLVLIGILTLVLGRRARPLPGPVQPGLRPEDRRRAQEVEGPPDAGDRF